MSHSDTHLHRYARVWIIALHNDILAREVIDTLHSPLPPKLREWLGFALQLHLERFDMVFVYVGIAELNDKLVRFGVGNVRHHVREKGV